MTPGRKLVYDFIGLPHHIQMRIGHEMGYSEHLPGEDDIQMFCRWIAATRQAGHLDQFRLLVEREVYQGQ